MPRRTKLAAAGLIALMSAGSLLMWVVNPIFWLWLASQLTSSSEPSMGPYLLVIVGIAGTMAAVGKGLGVLNRVHRRMTRGDAAGRWHAPWLRSLRGDRRPSHDTGVLDVVMVVTVAIAAVAMGIWFLFFAGSSLGPA
jgi:hypothetical protein